MCIPPSDGGGEGEKLDGGWLPGCTVHCWLMIKTMTVHLGWMYVGKVTQYLYGYEVSKYASAG